MGKLSVALISAVNSLVWIVRESSGANVAKVGAKKDAMSGAMNDTRIDSKNVASNVVQNIGFIANLFGVATFVILIGMIRSVGVVVRGDKHGMTEDLAGGGWSVVAHGTFIQSLFTLTLILTFHLLL